MSDEKDLIESFNALAKHVGTATIAFLGFCAYIGKTVASTTDEMLLLRKNVGPALLDLQLSL